MGRHGTSHGPVIETINFSKLELVENLERSLLRRAKTGSPALKTRSNRGWKVMYKEGRKEGRKEAVEPGGGKKKKRKEKKGLKETSLRGGGGISLPWSRFDIPS